MTGAWLTKRISPFIAYYSVIVADGLAAYKTLANEMALDLVVVQNQRGQRTKGAYHIQHVNAYHSKLKQWINGHFHGVATKYLNHYLWLRHEVENKHIQRATDLFSVAIRKIPQLS